MRLVALSPLLFLAVAGSSPGWWQLHRGRQHGEKPPIAVPDQAGTQISSWRQGELAMCGRIADPGVAQRRNDLVNGTTRAASSPASRPTTPEAAWDAILMAFRAGDEAALASVTSQRGQHTIMRYALRADGEPELTPGQRMKNAAAFLPVRLVFSKRTDTTAESMIPSRRAEVIVFEKVAESWKLDDVREDK
jgi:hypothetical protein